MALEIELKARLEDHAPIKERLSIIGCYCRSYRKSDSYWLSLQSVNPAVRVRREYGQNADGTVHNSVLATFKVKEITEGIEVSDEREFTVSDAALFEELLGRLGLHQAICKEKNGWAWTITGETAELHEAAEFPILAELSLVTGLGWFLELEIIYAGNCKETIAECRRRLLEMLEKLEIPVQSIEERPYTVLLGG